MKIIHVITGLATGGAERALYNLLYGGLAKHFDNHVISLGNEGAVGRDIRALGVTVTNLGMRGSPLPFLGLVKLHWLVKQFRPALIQGWMYHGNLASSLACFLAPGRPVLAWNIRCSQYDLRHEKLMTQMVIRANRLFSSTPDILLYNSHLSRKQHEGLGYSSLNGQVIPNGIDMKVFFFSSTLRQSVRSELGIPADAQVVGHVARLHPMKDHPLFLKVAVGLVRQYPGVHFILSGQGVSLENRALEKLVPVQVRSRFHLLNERDDVARLMCAMDIFCLCSAWGEGFPNVIGEAMATGLPCVATDIGDSSVIIGKAGIVVPPRNEKALANGLESLITMPGEKRRALGVSAQERIHANYELGDIIEQYAVLYEKLIKEKEVF